LFIVSKLFTVCGAEYAGCLNDAEISEKKPENSCETVSLRKFYWLVKLAVRREFHRTLLKACSTTTV